MCKTVSAEKFARSDSISFSFSFSPLLEKNNTNIYTPINATVYRVFCVSSFIVQGPDDISK